jgi:PBP1b-binding outer membrane lipoprotein LpoB
MKRRLLSILMLALSALVLSACLGPKPVVQSYNAEPPSSPDQPFRVEAVVHNTGPGEGEVLVEVSLTNKQTGAILRRDEQHIALQTGETEHVLFELNLPPSAQDLPSDQIEVKVEAHYPIS